MAAYLAAYERFDHWQDVTRSGDIARRLAGYSPPVTILNSGGTSKMPKPSQTVLNPHSKVAGQSTSEWTQEWWTWAEQSPAAQNPLRDLTGHLANQDNDRDVFFVGGTESGPAERTFTVPADKPLLLPMIAAFDTLDPKSVENKLMAEFKTSVTNLFAEIDGVPVKHPQSYFELTGFFSMGPTQEGSLINELGAPVGADLSPTRAAGYWLMVDGLSPGEHTLHFGGSSTGFDGVGAFSVNVVDHITVR